MSKLAAILSCLVFPLLACGAEQPADPGADVLAALEQRILYAPRKYQASDLADFKARGGVRIDYDTAQGHQAVWLILPAGRAQPEKLWVFCGGNAALALQWEPFCRALPFKSDAYLLVDYPGYGECQGLPSPKSMRENMKESILAAAARLKIDKSAIPGTVCVFGHSLGCAAALLGADEFKLRSAVLCAPFTSTSEMAHALLGLPKDFPLKHNFDNRVGLAAMQQNGGHAWIFHGDADQVIPVEMSKTMAREFKQTVTLNVVAGAGHNDVIEVAQKEIIAAMAEARRTK